MLLRARRIRGYTLIEILISLTIIAVLFGVGYASFRDFSRRQTLAGVAKQVQGDLRLAQQMALSGQRPVGDASCDSTKALVGYRFFVLGSGGGYRLIAECSNGPAASYKEVTLPSGVSISIPSPNPIIFKVLGQGTNLTSGSSATLTLIQLGTGSTVTVTVTAEGGIK